MPWNTDTVDFAATIKDFEQALPGWWWSVGQCAVGAHASCGVDGKGEAAHLLEGIPKSHPYNEGFHEDTDGGSPAEALRGVLVEARAFVAAQDDGQGGAS